MGNNTSCGEGTRLNGNSCVPMEIVTCGKGTIRENRPDGVFCVKNVLCVFFVFWAIRYSTADFASLHIDFNMLYCMMFENSKIDCHTSIFKYIIHNVCW